MQPRLSWIICAATLIGGMAMAFAATASPAVSELASIRQFDFNGFDSRDGVVTISTNGTVKLRINLVSEDVVRVWLDPIGQFNKQPSFAVLSESWAPVQYSVTDQGTYLRISTAKLAVRVQKRPLAVDFYREDDRTPISLDDRARGMEWGEEKNVSIFRKLESDEHIYGLGQDNTEFLGTLDRRGTVRELWTGQRINHGKVTADVPIPFLLSTGGAGGGYGVFFDNSYHTTLDLGKSSNDVYSWRAAGGEAVYYFIYGPKFAHIVDRYTALTGRPSLPNLWTLGYMQSKCAYYTWEEIDDVIKSLRTKQIPNDSLAIDFDWPEQLQNYRWAPRWNGESPQRLSDYSKQGIKFMISQSGPMIRKDSSNYQDGLRNGIFATDGKGQTVTCGYYGGDLMDFTAPNMKDWLWPQISHLQRDGIKGWWLDLTEPEGEPAGTVYQGGAAARIHNVFSLLTSRTYHEMLTASDPNSRVFILTRTGFSGIQRYGAAIWTGDIYSDYETFAAQVPALLNSGLSGIPMWSNDSGGFLEGYYKNNLEAHGRLYQRWLQFSAFVPIARAHHVGMASPTDFGSEVEESSRHYLQMRYRLLPYLYSYAWESHLSGAPMIRPLIFEYQSDPKVVNIKDEFLFGSEILVAPVLTEDTTSRSVYLPEGKWFGYEDGQEYVGGKFYEVAAPLQRIPVFVKSGAIIPMAPPMLSTDEKPWDPLTIDVYPDGESNFVLYTDDGKTMSFERDRGFTETRIQSSLSNNKTEILTIKSSNDKFVPQSYIVLLHLKSMPLKAVVNDQGLSFAATMDDFNRSAKGAFWEAGMRVLYVKFNREGALTHQLKVEMNGNLLRK